MKSFHKSMNLESSRNLEAKRFFYAFSDRIKEELTKFMKIAEANFQSPNHKVNKEEEFKKHNTELNKMISALRE